MNPDLVQSPLFDDAIRFIHLLAVAIGLGASFFADYTVFRRINAPVTQAKLDLLHRSHGIIWGSLSVMWLSGVVLIYLRTGFVWEDVSPKLMAKVVVVTVLTLNAAIIGFFAVPRLAQNLGLSALDFPLRIKAPMAVIAGVSTTSWLLALALGSSSVLAQGQAVVFYRLLTKGYGACALVALVATIILHLAARPQTLPDAKPVK